MPESVVMMMIVIAAMLRPLLQESFETGKEIP